MKALIVDDEKHVRDAIRLLVDWESLGIEEVLEAADGASAIAIIEAERPQIVYTDVMMPHMDGIELLRWIRDNAPTCKTIVISGHDDFEFVRGAVKYGGMDYLLKPIDAAQLVEITEKAVRGWAKEERERLESQQKSIRMNALQPVYYDKLFSNLLDEPDSFAAHQEQLRQEFPELTAGIMCRVSLIAFDTLPKKLRSKFDAHTDLLLYSLTNIGNEIMGKPRQGFAFRYWNNRYPVALLHWGTPDRSRQLLETFNEGLYRTFGTRVEFGLGLAHPFPGGAARSFKEADAALRQRNALQRKALIHSFDPNEPVRPAELHMSDYEERFKLAVRSASREKIEDAVKEWIEGVRRTGIATMDHLELWRHEFQVLQSRWVKEWLSRDDAESLIVPGSDELPVPLDAEGMLSLDRWGEQMTESLHRLSELVRKSDRQENNLIHEIARYVQQRLDRDISVQEIAAQFYLSREYVSRRFKQEFGETISDFILRLRMERAQTLLVNPTLKIAQIAHMTGYDDEKYFSKVFKKAFGLTPAEYRRKMTGEG
jgi:two-component system response regulator YesN